MALTQTFTITTDLPLSREEVFTFYSDPRNLERLTPPWLGFRIRTPEPLPVGEGAEYDYNSWWWHQTTSSFRIQTAFRPTSPQQWRFCHHK
jgi:hypothetical protein